MTNILPEINDQRFHHRSSRNSDRTREASMVHTGQKDVLPASQPDNKITYEHSTITDLFSHQTGLERADAFWAHLITTFSYHVTKLFRLWISYKQSYHSELSKGTTTGCHRVIRRIIELLARKKYSQILSKRFSSLWE